MPNSIASRKIDLRIDSSAATTLVCLASEWVQEGRASTRTTNQKALNKSRPVTVS